VVIGVWCSGTGWSDEPSRGSAGDAASSSTNAELIGEDEFLRSPFGEFFRAGDYAKALDAIDALAAQYPQDPLIKRYRALTLDRLGRYDEALRIYRELLASHPDHLPTRFFLGQTYSHMGDANAATKEWRWVVEQSPAEEYRQWAEELLKRQQAAAADQTAPRKRVYVFGDTGFEYDSNPLLKPNDKGVAAQGDEKQAERWSVNVGVGYPIVLQPDLRVDAISMTRQSLHTEGLTQVNFTGQEVGLAASKRVNVWNRDVIVGGRYDFLTGWLDGDLFSVTNRWLLSADARLTPRTRTYAYNRFSVANFGPDGSNPPQTSRDGFGYDLGATQYFYTADFRRYVFVSEEFNLSEAHGGNFTRRGMTSRLGFHTPVLLVAKTDLDVSGGFGLGTYPDFSPLSSLDPTRREDTNWDLYTGLTYSWTPQVATRAFYRYINANNRNDIFQYDRHIAGVQLLFSQYF